MFRNLWRISSSLRNNHILGLLPFIQLWVTVDCQVFYTLDVSQYAIGANEKENFYYCINKALQKREPQLMQRLSGQVVCVMETWLASAFLDPLMCLYWAVSESTQCNGSHFVSSESSVTISSSHIRVQASSCCFSQIPPLSSWGSQRPSKGAWGSFLSRCRACRHTGQKYQRLSNWSSLGFCLHSQARLDVGKYCETGTLPPTA